MEDLGFIRKELSAMTVAELRNDSDLRLPWS